MDDLGVTSWRVEVDVFRVWRPRYWLALEDTFLGCLAHNRIYNGTVMNVNLTEIGKLHNGQDRAQACYQLCQNKMAFAGFIAVSYGVGGLMDRCGCHYEYDLDFMFEEDDGTCDGSMSHSRIYCGPGNIECFSRAGGLGGGNTYVAPLPRSSGLWRSLLRFFKMMVNSTPMVVVGIC
ncbi:uncharacterized protein LOC119588084 isoform X2 [Penaeus monodon]|uniref:uncharacterized protein LOC119588084 isoform X2 n=1 Tax=Penaeus monodon TaxID=6687 RepID=UPI0018A78D7B|nr:uncharacterized protein LOC119588084 isoform X2 [Penaeus monodon]